MEEATISAFLLTIFLWYVAEVLYVYFPFSDINISCSLRTFFLKDILKESLFCNYMAVKNMMSANTLQCHFLYSC